MIHQIIFAHARPDWSEQQFQDYWLNIHAVRYASRIPQIRLYKVCHRLPFSGPIPSFEPFQGSAEIWIENDEEQLASLRSSEFIEGARADEPNWAAFWDTVFLATDTHVLIDAPERERTAGVKLYIVLKRRAGLPLATFREYALKIHGEKVLHLPGLHRFEQCHTRDGMYASGEWLLDAVLLLWFDRVDAIGKALSSPAFTRNVGPDFENFAEARYLRCMVAQEHWVIGPDPR